MTRFTGYGQDTPYTIGLHCLHNSLNGVVRTRYTVANEALPALLYWFASSLTGAISALHSTSADELPLLH